MRTVVLLFDAACLYESVILNYFLNFRKKEVVFATLDGKGITAMEGFSVNAGARLSDIPPETAETVVVTGGNVRAVDCEAVHEYLRRAKDSGALIAGICAGADVLDHAGILEGIDSTHSLRENIVVTDRVITARANAFTDFAIETARKMDLFESERDLMETLSFWKDHQPMQ